MMEQRYVKPTATHVAAELLDKKPGVRVPILTREEAQNHKVMLNEKEVLHSHRLYWFGRRTQDIVFSLLALVVLFQPEMRSALEKMGGSSLKGLKNISESKDNSVWMLAIREVSTAAAQMAAEKTGALIVFERGTRLGEIAATGTVCDAQVSAYLLRNMFFNKAPLHDGAVLLRDGRIHAAGCLLPLTQQDINRDLGTRHRAAIGLSENSDAAVVVVSEETGVISVAVDGYLTRGYNADTLRSRLTELVGPVSQVKEGKKIFRFMRKGADKNAERGGKI